MTTDGCDILILDEVLGLVDRGIITEAELTALVEAKGREHGAGSDGNQYVRIPVSLCG